MSQPIPNRMTVLQLSGEALVDPRTVQRYLRGEPIRPISVCRIERAKLRLINRGEYVAA